MATIEKALDVVRQMVADGQVSQEVAEKYFPELKESEGERIIKAIKSAVLQLTDIYLQEKYGLKQSDCIAWLERQAQKPADNQFTPEQASILDKHIDKFLEQKPADNVEPKFKVGDFVKNVNHHKQPIYKVVDIDKECYICISDDVTLGDNTVVHFTFDNPYLRLVEQNPAWSEEDESMLQNILECLKNGLRKLPTDILKYESWLKSLRPQIQWKPSEEQMDAIDYVKNFDYGGYKDMLVSLYYDLKKLRG